MSIEGKAPQNVKTEIRRICRTQKFEKVTQQDKLLILSSLYCENVDSKHLSPGHMTFPPQKFETDPIRQAVSATQFTLSEIWSGDIHSK